MIKSLVIFASALTVVASGTGVIAQSGVVSLDQVTNTISTNVLQAGNTHTVAIRYSFLGNATSSLAPWYGSNGFEIYSPDGADWVSLTGTSGPLVNQLGFSVVRYKKHFIFDGTSWTRTGNNGDDPAGGSIGVSSRAGFFLAAFDAQALDGYHGGVDNGIALTFQFQSRMADVGKTICLDTCAAVTAWEWSNGDEDFPVWDNGLGVDGPRCWTVGSCPTGMPQWCTGNHYELSFSYCNEVSCRLCAIPYCPFGPIEYRLRPTFDDGSFGSIDPQTGQWTWSNPELAPGSSVAIQFVAEQAGGISEPLTLTLTAVATGCDCCVGRVGDANGSGEDEPTVGDISLLIDHLFISGAWLNCLAEADVNQSGGATPTADDITIGDISALIDYLFISGPDVGELPQCL